MDKQFDSTGGDPLRPHDVRYLATDAAEQAALAALYGRTTLDRTDAGGGTGPWLDGRTGAVRRVLPLGPCAARADVFATWLEWLHMAEMFGLPWKIAVSGTELLVTMLTAGSHG